MNIYIDTYKINIHNTLKATKRNRMYNNIQYNVNLFGKIKEMNNFHSPFWEYILIQQIHYTHPPQVYTCALLLNVIFKKLLQIDTSWFEDST